MYLCNQGSDQVHQLPRYKFVTPHPKVNHRIQTFKECKISANSKMRRECDQRLLFGVALGMVFCMGT